MNEWEIWLAEVAYEDNPTDSKKRPVLILQPGLAVSLVSKITSHAPRSNYYGEYQISDWQGAGLLYPSTIRLSQRFDLNHNYMIRKLGNLQPVDILNVEKILSRLR